MLHKSMNWLFGAVALGVCLMAAGCCGPVGVGCGVMGDSCNDCSVYSTERPLPIGPMDQLQQWKRSLVCGGGCGEVYYGEWMSTPPDAYDPCCGNQFVGGATKCQPFCWQPGALLGSLYGQRFCDGGVDCGCDSCGSMGYEEFGCDSCGGGGCATCDSGYMVGSNTRMANESPARMMRQQVAGQTQMARPQMRNQMPPQTAMRQQQVVRTQQVARPQMTQQQMRAQQQMQRTAQRMRTTQSGQMMSGQTIRR
jgi:hypothetical protein